MHPLARAARRATAQKDERKLDEPEVNKDEDSIKSKDICRLFAMQHPARTEQQCQLHRGHPREQLRQQRESRDTYCIIQRCPRGRRVQMQVGNKRRFLHLADGQNQSSKTEVSAPCAENNQQLEDAHQQDSEPSSKRSTRPFNA